MTTGLSRKDDMYNDLVDVFEQHGWLVSKGNQSEVAYIVQVCICLSLLQTNYYIYFWIQLWFNIIIETLKAKNVGILY